MTTLLDLLLSVILIGGGLFALVGSYGLLRLPNPGTDEGFRITLDRGRIAGTVRVER